MWQHNNTEQNSALFSTPTNNRIATTATNAFGSSYVLKKDLPSTKPNLNKLLPPFYERCFSRCLRKYQPEPPFCRLRQVVFPARETCARETLVMLSFNVSYTMKEARQSIILTYLISLTERKLEIYFYLSIFFLLQMIVQYCNIVIYVYVCILKYTYI